MINLMLYIFLPQYIFFNFKKYQRENQERELKAREIGKSETTVRWEWNDPRGNTHFVCTPSEAIRSNGGNFQQGVAFPGLSGPALYP